MTQVPRWFERQFDSRFPPELLPNLLVRLRGTAARLEEILQNTPHSTLIGKPGGQWSAQEHAGHLLDLEPLWLARLNDYLAGHDALTAADLTNRKTHEAQHNARPLSEILAAFRASRLLLLQRAALPDAAGSTRTLPHPRLKTPMRLADHLYFVAEHDDHHLARIVELLKI